MGPKKVFNIALIGFGTVGTGVAKILLEQGDYIYEKTSLRFNLTHIVDTDTTSPRPVTLPAGLLHNNLDKVIADRDVDIAVELVGGTTVAADIEKRLLAAGKHVITANKALLAERGQEIFEVARQNSTCVAFEASCGGGIPVLRAITSGLIANRINAMYGIVNGTCNYILTEMSKAGKEYSTALKEAQQAGFAEADPTLDVNGSDSAHKLAILATLAFGREIDYTSIPTTGIDDIQLKDIVYAREMGYVMKLLAIAEQTDCGISLRVHPAFIGVDEPLAQVSGPFNAVSIFGDGIGHTSYYGRGAGMMPTASAVVADIIDVARGNACTVFGTTAGLGRKAPPANQCPVDDVCSKFYLRIQVVEKPGVFAQIAHILGERNISMAGCMQHESKTNESVPVVIMTHKARQGAVNLALQDMKKLEVVKEKPVCIHIVASPEENLQ